jgi:hypothetical protein
LLGFLRLFMPDFAWVSLIGGGFAAVWAVLRSLLVLATLRSRSQPGIRAASR